MALSATFRRLEGEALGEDSLSLPCSNVSIFIFLIAWTTFIAFCPAKKKGDTQINCRKTTLLYTCMYYNVCQHHHTTILTLPTPPTHPPHHHTHIIHTTHPPHHHTHTTHTTLRFTLSLLTFQLSRAAFFLICSHTVVWMSVVLAVPPEILRQTDRQTDREMKEQQLCFGHWTGLTPDCVCTCVRVMCAPTMDVLAPQNT